MSKEFPPGFETSAHEDADQVAKLKAKEENIPGLVRGGAEHSTAEGGSVEEESGIPASEFEHASDVKAPGEVDPNTEGMENFTRGSGRLHLVEKPSGAYTGVNEGGIIRTQRDLEEMGAGHSESGFQGFSDLEKTGEDLELEKEFAGMLGHEPGNVEEYAQRNRYVASRRGKKPPQQEKKAA